MSSRKSTPRKKKKVAAAVVPRVVAPRNRPAVRNIALQLDAMPPSVRATLEVLSPQERRYVIAYVGTAKGNGTLAAKMSGVSGGYSTWAARSSQMLRAPRVRVAIDAWMKAFEMSAAEVTAKFVDLAGANLGPFITFDRATGGLIIRCPDEDTWEAHKHWVKQITADPETGRVTSVVVHDALSALRDTAKILKLYSDAPIVQFNFYLQQLSDDALRREYESAIAEEARILRRARGEVVPGPNDEDDDSDGEDEILLLPPFPDAPVS